MIYILVFAKIDLIKLDKHKMSLESFLMILTSRKAVLKGVYYYRAAQQMAATFEQTDWNVVRAKFLMAAVLVTDCYYSQETYSIIHTDISLLQCMLLFDVTPCKVVVYRNTSWLWFTGMYFN